MIERCVFVSLVTITWGSSSPTRTSCRWVDENTSINRCVVGRAHGRASGYNGNVPSPAGHRLAQLPLQQRLHQQGEATSRQRAKSTADTERIGHGGAAHQTANLCSKLNCASLPRPQGGTFSRGGLSGG